MLTFQPASALLVLSPSIDLPLLADLTWCWFLKFHLANCSLQGLGRKIDIYGSLLYDLKCTRLVVDLIPIEIRCLGGHFMPETLTHVATACCVLKRTIRSLFEQAACVAISCTYRIFNSRFFPEWDLVHPLV